MVSIDLAPAPRRGSGFGRYCRVFLPRQLIVYGTDAPEQLRPVADELDLLEEERVDAKRGAMSVSRHPAN